MFVKKGKVLFSSLLLILVALVSACCKHSDQTIHRVTVDSKSNEIDTESNTRSNQPQYHLLGMEQLFYHKDFICKDFELSEKWIDEAPYYQFANAEYDIKILVDESQTNATLYHSEQSIPLDLKYGITMGAGGTESSIRLIDLTGDDYVEVVLWGSTGGTGGANQYIRIYNLEKMQEIVIEDYLPKLHSFLEIEHIDSEETDKATFRIKTGNGEEYVRTINVPLLEQGDFEFTENGLKSHNFITIDEQLKKIDIEYGVTVDGAVYRDYLGVIKGSIIYSAESGMFELVEDYYFK